MMRKKYLFSIDVSEDGEQSVRAGILNRKHSLLESFAWVFPNETEVKWIKKDLLTKVKEGSPLSGQNTFHILLKGDTMDLYHDFNKDFVQTIPSEIVFEFIDHLLAFYKKYNEGGIPGVIPSSKSKELIIVPKTMVKNGYLKEVDFTAEE